jgi:hypothetical protein
MIAPFNYNLLNEFKSISNWTCSYDKSKYTINIIFYEKIEENEKSMIQAIIQKEVHFIGLKIIKYIL